MYEISSDHCRHYLIFFLFLSADIRYRPITRQEFDNAILNVLYDQEGCPFVETLHPHRISTFFIALALGAHYEQESAVGESDSETYNLLALAALSLSSIIHEVTCSALQALFLIIQYHYFTDPGTDETRWLLFGALCRAAQVVSARFLIIPSLAIQLDSCTDNCISPLPLDRPPYVPPEYLWNRTSDLVCPNRHLSTERDSAPWNLDPQEVQRRRTLFWEIYTWDSWAVSFFLLCHHSFSFGEPLGVPPFLVFEVQDQLTLFLFVLFVLRPDWSIPSFIRDAAVPRSQSFVNARPGAFRLEDTDCKFPDDDGFVRPDGQVEFSCEYFFPSPLSF